MTHPRLLEAMEERISPARLSNVMVGLHSGPKFCIVQAAGIRQGGGPLSLHWFWHGVAMTVMFGGVHLEIDIY